MIKLVQEYVKTDLELNAIKEKLKGSWNGQMHGDYTDTSKPASEAYIKVNGKIYHVQGLSYREVLIAPDVFE